MKRRGICKRPRLCIKLIYTKTGTQIEFFTTSEIHRYRTYSGVPTEQRGLKRSIAEVIFVLFMIRTREY
jgi:hypothetical protein